MSTQDKNNNEGCARQKRRDERLDVIRRHDDSYEQTVNRQVSELDTTTSATNGARARRNRKSEVQI